MLVTILQTFDDATGRRRPAGEVYDIDPQVARQWIADGFASSALTLQSGAVADSAPFPRVLPAPSVLAGNGRVTVLLPSVPGAASFLLVASNGVIATAAGTATRGVITGLTNGAAVTVQVAVQFGGGASWPLSLPSRSVTPSALSGLGDIGIDPIVAFVPDFMGLANGASVPTMTDYSGNAYDATSPGGSNPTIVTNAANGRSCISGSGTQHMLFDSRIDLYGGSFTDISVWALNTASPSDSRYYSTRQTNTSTEQNYVEVDANGTASQTAPVFRVLSTFYVSGSSSAAGAVPALLSIDWPGRLRVNGAVQAAPVTCSSMNAERKTTQIFGYAGNQKRLNGRCFAFTRWPSSITQAKRWQVEAWLAGLFGLTVSQS